MIEVILRLRGHRLLLIAASHQLALDISQSIFDTLLGPLSRANDLKLHCSAMAGFKGFLVTLGDSSFLFCVDDSIVVGVRILLSRFGSSSLSGGKKLVSTT